jgi:phospho-N-acetylmuramoyl-pentapeptide-transferase
LTNESAARLVVAGLTSFALVALLGLVAVPLLRRLKVGQRVRDDGPETHLKKMGVPTMGGLFFAVPALALALAWSPRDPRVSGLALFALVFAMVGFADDYIKVIRRRPLGLRARYKLAVQIPASLALGYWAAHRLGLGTAVAIPFGLGSLDLGPLYLPFIVLFAIWFSNAVNITDGVDGLLAGAMVPSMLAYLLVALVAEQAGLSLLCATVIGACAGFLLYNRHPAKVIMGDVGSLALGGTLTGLAVLTKTEILLGLIGLLYALEALSVVLQVISFRSTGRRIFRMSPIHHHFELLGWPETKVVGVFWLFSALSGLIGLFGMGGMGR